MMLESLKARVVQACAMCHRHPLLFWYLCSLYQVFLCLPQELTEAKHEHIFVSDLIIYFSIVYSNTWESKLETRGQKNILPLTNDYILRYTRLRCSLWHCARQFEKWVVSGLSVWERLWPVVWPLRKSSHPTWPVWRDPSDPESGWPVQHCTDTLELWIPWSLGFTLRSFRPGRLSINEFSKHFFWESRALVLDEN